VHIGDTVTLDGSESSDVDDTFINYEWVLVSKPADSQTVIQNPDQSVINISIDKKGFYEGYLVVNDGSLRSNSATFQITCLNQPPMAVIKGPQIAILVKR
jgi:hypothetical protein